MSDDYYRILGVDRDAAPERIRQAYRRKAKRCHPDATGSCGSAAGFRAVEEAYETLRDPQRRRDYDRVQARGRAVEGEQAAGARSDAPSVAGGWVGAWGGFGSFGAFAVPEFAQRPASGEGLLEVILSAREARQGAVIPVEVPLRRRCPDCGGFAFWGWGCPTCGGSGWVRTACRLRLHIPPGVRDGRELRCELGGDPECGAAGVSGFRLRVAVQPW